MGSVEITPKLTPKTSALPHQTLNRGEKLIIGIENLKEKQNQDKDNSE